MSVMTGASRGKSGAASAADPESVFYLCVFVCVCTYQEDVLVCARFDGTQKGRGIPFNFTP